jgi:DNA-binding transcriptional LysR family regulator
MLRAGEVDVAVAFEYRDDTGRAEPGVRRSALLTEPLYLVTPTGAATGLTDHRDTDWIGGCERCRSHLVRRCAAEGFAPRIAFTTDDYVAVQALVAAGLGVTILPELALRAHHSPGIRATRLDGAGRAVWIGRYGAPPDPPATAALVEQLTGA